MWASYIGLRKGLPALVEAWKKWFTNQNAALYIIGMPTVTSDIIFNNKRQGEVFPGLFLDLDIHPAQDPRKIEFIGSASVGVLPTLEDAQPSSLLEMASCGLPIITTVESGVEFEDTFCKYIDTDNSTEIVDALQYWYEKKGSIIKYGEIAREFILRNHTWESLHFRFSEILSNNNYKG